MYNVIEAPWSQWICQRRMSCEDARFEGNHVSFTVRALYWELQGGYPTSPLMFGSFLVSRGIAICDYWKRCWQEATCSSAIDYSSFRSRIFFFCKIYWDHPLVRHIVSLELLVPGLFFGGRSRKWASNYSKIHPDDPTVALTQGEVLTPLDIKQNTLKHWSQNAGVELASDGGRLGPPRSFEEKGWWILSPDHISGIKGNGRCYVPSVI